MRAAVIGALVALVALGTSCSTAGDNADGPAAASDPAGEAPADAESAVEVDIADFSFRPEAVEIAVGDTVRWVNRDATRHTVTAGADAEPSGAFEFAFADRGDTAEHVFTEPGTYSYFCTPHPFMQGTITVRG